jgi:hypothetical protein
MKALRDIENRADDLAELERLEAAHEERLRKLPPALVARMYSGRPGYEDVVKEAQRALALAQWSAKEEQWRLGTKRGRPPRRAAKC